ncbi:MAG: hypothetical protein BMS9Abin29_0172 [Gemmatimonadota bacterium]|nr:MAG: hypothetical protein BMS9Abin29_0172 [Gemmatimonadota bacterium]
MTGLFSKPTKESASWALISGDFEGAIKQYRRLIKGDAHDHELFNDLGVALLESGQPAEAVQAFSTANSLDETAIHTNNLGRAHLRMGAHAAAREAFERASALDPDDPQPGYNLTVCLREQGDMEASFNALLAFSERHRDHVAAHGDLALHYQDRQDMDVAVSHCERALALDAGYVPARLNLIRMLCDAGRYPDSLPHLEAMAEQGAEVVVAAKDGQAQISIDGRPFWQGTYATE